LLNHKRERLQEIELRYTMRVIIAADDAQIEPQFRIEKVRTRSPDEMPAVVAVERSMLPPPVEAEDDEEEEAEAVGAEDDDDDTEEDTAEQRAADADGSGGDDAERRRKRRRRRRRGGRRDEQQPGAVDETPGEPVEAVEATEAEAIPASVADEPEPSEAAGEGPSEAGENPVASDDDPKNRRRGRRGGRRRRRENEGELSPFAVPGADQPELQPVYAGPTPADPFGGRAFDIFDVMDQVERAAEAKPAPRTSSAPEIVNHTAPEPDAPGADAESGPDMVEESAALTSDPVPLASEAIGPDAPGEEAPEPAAQVPVALEPEALGSAATPQEAPEPVRPRDEIANTAAPEPAGEALRAHAEHAAISPPVPANDTTAEIAIPEPPPTEQLVKPILIGADGEPPAEPKRGWWRR
jgi:ribonuclease E